MGAPFVEALLLVGIHTYLGLHVLRRGIIFVDLALAQVAALGGLVAFLIGLEPGSLGASLFSLTFALSGAALLSQLRPRPGTRVPQEALIGLVYAMASSIALLIMAKAPEGASELQETLTGTLLWVRWETVGKAAVTYGIVALIHFLCRKSLIRVSEDSDKAAAEGLNVSLWDFIFYGTFAVVVTHSVRTAGVLLVFVFLVAPAVLALLLFKSFRAQLLFGWLVGLIVCVLGLWLSYTTDLPTGPMVVGVYAAVLALAGVYRWLRPEEGHPGQPVKRLIGLFGSLGLIALALYAVAHLIGGEADHEALVPTSTAAAPSNPGASAPPTTAAPAAPSNGVLAKVEAGDLPEEKLAACAGEKDAAALKAAVTQATEGDDRLALALCLVAVSPAEGKAALAALAADTAQPAMVRDEAGKAAAARP